MRRIGLKFQHPHFLGPSGRAIRSSADTWNTGSLAQCHKQIMKFHRAFLKSSKWTKTSSGPTLAENKWSPEESLHPFEYLDSGKKMRT
mmetsp:Transcript_25613/g.35666  ORF Transcript_25613/g.35666 Transcript_25613/m.35666 type:complete len:88 (-) Transcript_25613:186-449(-)